MGQSLSQVILHIVFSTKYRKDLIPSHMLAPLHGYIASPLSNHKAEAFRVGGTENHIHIACSLPRTIPIADLVRDLKRPSSKFMKEEVPQFQWQDGYGAFSISPSHRTALLHYIDTQEEHHSERSYKDEVRTLCDTYNVTYDEKYLWE